MKRLVFVVAGAALALSACGGQNEDALENAELNQPAAENLDEMANQAAMDAANAEAAAIAAQQEAINAETPAEEPAEAPTDEDEQNVSGM